MSNLCEIEELCQYDRTCPFYAENCRKTEHQESKDGSLELCLFGGCHAGMSVELVGVVDNSTAQQAERRAAMLLIVTDGGLLMHHRDNKPEIANPDCWAGFGGAVEDGETVEEALHREVLEETGLDIRDAVFLTDAIDYEGDGRLVSLFYVVGDFRPADIDLSEGAGVGIQRIADLPGLKITPFVRRAIESHLLPLLALRSPLP